MLDWIKNLMESLGYVGVTVLMFLENVFPPLPSELIMPLAGFTASQGELTLIGVIIAGTIGSVVGALPLYYLGRFVGEEKLKQWADRYGKWLTVSSKEIERADQWFERHGNKTVFFGRLIPGIRSLVSIPAGISGMNIATFLLYTAVGSSIWTAVLAFLGSLLGEQYEKVDAYLGPVSYVVVGLLVVGAGIWIWRRKQRPAIDQSSA
jgi:membrane protein DedA with SNARE-associated domain